MKKLNLLAIFAMLFSISLFITSCGDDDDDVDTSNLIGAWEVTAVDAGSDFTIEDGVKVGDILFFGDDNTYELTSNGDYETGKWKLDGSTIVVYDASDEEGEIDVPAAFKIENLSENNMTLVLDYGSLIRITIQLKRYQ